MFSAWRGSMASTWTRSGHHVAVANHWTSPGRWRAAARASEAGVELELEGAVITRLLPVRMEASSPPTRSGRVCPWWWAAGPWTRCCRDTWAVPAAAAAAAAATGAAQRTAPAAWQCWPPSRTRPSFFAPSSPSAATAARIAAWASCSARRRAPRLCSAPATAQTRCSSPKALTTPGPKPSPGPPQTPSAPPSTTASASSTSPSPPGPRIETPSASSGLPRACSSSHCTCARRSRALR
mmetsp:Transcript_3175/g.9835  ORF Transcript_3175/g.9835 Transcript_3175/m.9835 type:complete len:238 (+) Transcript_3175:311-1024(+)